MVLAGGSGSGWFSSCFGSSGIKAGGGEPPIMRLGLWRGEREGLGFLSRFTGDLRRGDGDLDFLLLGLLA